MRGIHALDRRMGFKNEAKSKLPIDLQLAIIKPLLPEVTHTTMQDSLPPSLGLRFLLFSLTLQVI